MHLFILLLIFLLSPLPLFAKGLVPCGGPGEDICTLCHLIVGIDNIIDYIFLILGIVGFLILVIGGITYIVSAGNQAIVSAAKKAIFSGLIGFTIVLIAWVSINTVIVYLFPLNQEGNIGSKILGWSEFTCSSQSSQTAQGDQTSSSSLTTTALTPLSPSLQIPENPSLLMCPQDLTLVQGQPRSLQAYLVEEGTNASECENAGRTLSSQNITSTLTLNSPPAGVTFNKGLLTIEEEGEKTLSFSYDYSSLVPNASNASNASPITKTLTLSTIPQQVAQAQGVWDPFGGYTGGGGSGGIGSGSYPACDKSTGEGCLGQTKSGRWVSWEEELTNQIHETVRIAGVTESQNMYVYSSPSTDQETVWGCGEDDWDVGRRWASSLDPCVGGSLKNRTYTLRLPVVNGLLKNNLIGFEHLMAGDRHMQWMYALADQPYDIASAPPAGVKTCELKNPPRPYGGFSALYGCDVFKDAQSWPAGTKNLYLMFRPGGPIAGTPALHPDNCGKTVNLNGTMQVYRCRAYINAWGYRSQ